MLDRPSPGSGYLLLLLGLVLGTGATFVLMAFTLRDAALPGQVAAVVLFAVPMAGLVLAPLHAAVRTRYEIADGRLRLRAGLVIRADIECSEVATVERVGFIPRILGWGGGRGLANRLTDGLRITLESGAVYYISPSDPEAFAARIQAAASG